MMKAAEIGEAIIKRRMCRLEQLSLFELSKMAVSNRADGCLRPSGFAESF